MLYDISENKLVTDWLRGRGGFKVGMVIGAIVAIVWLPLAYTSPQTFQGEVYGFSMVIPVPIAGFLAAGVIWGLLFRFAAGVTWFLGFGLVMAVCAGVSEGLAASLGWTLDWGFGVKTFYFRVDVEPQGIAVGAVKFLIHAVGAGAVTILGSLLATVVSTLFLRRLIAKRMRNVAPRLVGRFPARVRQVIDPTVRYSPSQ